MKVKIPGTRKLALLANVALGALVVVAGLVLLRDVLTFAVDPKSDVAPALEKAAGREANRALYYYAPVLDNNAFGFQAGKIRSLFGSEGRAARTGGLVILRGTVVSGEGEGYAVMEDKRGSQVVYGTGQEIEGAGKLVEVRRSMIVVEDGGERHEYELADIISMRQVTAPDRSGKGERRRNGDAGPEDFARKTAELSYVIDRDAVDASLENPERILTEARLTPQVVEGEQQGFVVSEIVEGGVYQSLGLRNGDVLKRINEFTLSDTQSALQAFTVLKGMDRIELDIVRNGKPMTLTYTMR